MKILVACECSGRVKMAFRAIGHDAWSCDIKPSEIANDKYHYQEDIFNIIDRQWNLMIAHPPCTYLTQAGIRWFNETRYGDKARERKRLREEALLFVKKLWDSNIDKICIENPMGYLNNHFKKPSQIIQPYYFGEEERKRTCLWLKNLPNLRYGQGIQLYLGEINHPNPTNIVKPKVYAISKSGKKFYGEDIAFYKTKDREELSTMRSRTFQGIANAMANQWG